MWPGSEPVKGVHECVGAPLNLYNWYLKKNMSNILLYSSQTYKIHLWIFRLHDLQQKYFLRCYSATWGFIPKTISRKLESWKVNHDWKECFLVFAVDWFSASSIWLPPRVLLIPEGVCLRFSDVWHCLQKEIVMFLYVSGGYLFICYLHLIHT